MTLILEKALICVQTIVRLVVTSTR